MVTLNGTSLFPIQKSLFSLNLLDVCDVLADFQGA